MKMTFPDKSVREYPEGTTGMEITKSISEGLARVAIGIFVNEVPFDLSRAINNDAEIKIVTFEQEEGKQIFWHSSAHLMAEAIESLYPGTKFGIGPAIENGYYYDLDLPDGVKLANEDLPAIESKMKELAKANNPYNRIEISWQEAVDFFKEKGDQYKIELLEGFKDQEITFYQQGNFTDLCRGTHVPSTGMIKSVKLLSIAGAYWRGDSSRQMMTRIYGVTFPKQSLLDEFIKLKEEAEKRDHRKLGRELELFLITPNIGGGLPVWLPNGTIIRRKLEDFIKKELLQRGYVEVITPHIGNLNLYKTSGHYPYYSESQFAPITVEDEEYLLKPMNCPHHHQIFSSKPRSYKDLPLRLAEFGTVYRYEQSGELSGLSRVRGFTQDDAHIYCTHQQLKDELINAIELTQLVFRTFDMPVKTRLSFRDPANPEKYAGSSEVWDLAEKEIQEVADMMKLDYFIGIGEAAFYGPKFDFIVKDAIGRKWQLGTVQVDYVMPERFRFISILIEHYEGNFPFWIAPVQISILPIGEGQFEYAKTLESKFKDLGFRTNLDDRSERVNRKIAESEQKKVPFALVLGGKEAEAGTASVREHTKGDIGVKTIDELIEIFTSLNAPGKSH
ncbi:MAG: threonine--tRNA ligase [Candidatus Kapabacteria bacterium]|nr:threonine--tRNA ligase [Candidatus Kapabacteria bacterium]